MLGGIAISLKQSGFDAIGAAVFAVVLTWWTDPVQSGARLQRRGGARRRGVLSVLAVLAVHGALSSWDRFWYAFAGYRLTQRSIATNADFGRFGTTWTIAAPIIVPAVAATIACLLARWRRSLSSSMLVLLAWTALATMAFAAGGQFHRHYWVILAFPLGTLAGAAVSLHPRAWVQSHGRSAGRRGASPARGA